VLTDAERAAARPRFEAQRKAIRDYLFDGTPSELKARRAFMFITTYRDEPLLRWPSTLLDGLVEFEQGFRMFRFRHARMVERMIGARTGTGGSPGLSYLEQTTAYRIFGNLLEARNFLVARRLLPLPTKTQMLRFNFGKQYVTERSKTAKQLRIAENGPERKHWLVPKLASVPQAHTASLSL
jgi:hypothetical protein